MSSAAMSITRTTASFWGSVWSGLKSAASIVVSCAQRLVHAVGETVKAAAYLVASTVKVAVEAVVDTAAALIGGAAVVKRCVVRMTEKGRAAVRRAIDAIKSWSPRAKVLLASAMVIGAGWCFVAAAGGVAAATATSGGAVLMAGPASTTVAAASATAGATVAGAASGAAGAVVAASASSAAVVAGLAGGVPTLSGSLLAAIGAHALVGAAGECARQVKAGRGLDIERIARAAALGGVIGPVADCLEGASKLGSMLFAGVAPALLEPTDETRSERSAKERGLRLVAA